MLEYVACGFSWLKPLFSVFLVICLVYQLIRLGSYQLWQLSLVSSLSIRHPCQLPIFRSIIDCPWNWSAASVGNYMHLMNMQVEKISEL